jgi:glutamine synthetase
MPFDKLANDFGCLSLGGRTFIEYVFLGGTALDLRCKTKVLGRAVSRLGDVPWVAVDGAFTGQASQGCSVVYLKPRALFRDPFRYGRQATCCRQAQGW